MSSQVTSLGGLAAFRFSERWVANSNSKFTARSYWSCEMSETEGTDLNAMEREPPIWTPPIGQISSGWQQAASLILCAALIAAGVYILSNYLRALVWALVLAVALWPAYDRLRRKTRRSFVKKLLPILVTALVGSTVFLPLTVLAIEVVREADEIVDWSVRRRLRHSGACFCLSIAIRWTVACRLVERALGACWLGKRLHTTDQHIFDSRTRTQHWA